MATEYINMDINLTTLSAPVSIKDQIMAYDEDSRSQLFDFLLSKGMFKKWDKGRTVEKIIRDLPEISNTGMKENQTYDLDNTSNSRKNTVKNTMEIFAIPHTVSTTKDILAEDETAIELMEKFRVMKEKFDIKLFNGIEKTTEPRAMGSIVSFVPAANKIAVNVAELEAMPFGKRELWLEENVWSKVRGSVNCCFGQQHAITQLKTLVSPNVNIDLGATDRYLGNASIALPIGTIVPVRDQNAPANTLIVGNYNYMELYYIQEPSLVPVPAPIRGKAFSVEMEASCLLRKPSNFVVITFDYTAA